MSTSIWKYRSEVRFNGSGSGLITWYNKVFQSIVHASDRSDAEEKALEEVKDRADALIGEKLGTIVAEDYEIESLKVFLPDPITLSLHKIALIFAHRERN